jgi:CMP-N,N'-diacetyllegionaminic acid synthase
MAKTYGVIPARSGSKGVLCKNKRQIAGKPLFWYSCVSALASKLDKVFLDTDDQDIIDFVSKEFPEIIIPYKRPVELASDTSTALDVAHHFLGHLKEKGMEIPENICWLQPTSPLRKTGDINSCLDLIKGNDSVISMVDVGACHPFKVREIKEGFLVPQDTVRAVGSTNRQQLPKMYICNGVIFLVKSECLLKKKSFYGDKSLPYIMDRDSSLNIDDEIDIALAEIMIKRERENG